jgi:hydroxymethylpyrimidine/phosphomethylpyrimidine kinase
MAVATVLTVQNTLGVSEVQVLDAEFVLKQLRAVLVDIQPQAAKTGALGHQSIIRALAEAAQDFNFPLVVDPVMVSKHGHPLLAPEAFISLKRELFPRAFLITPNAHEASALVGRPVATLDDAKAAAIELAQLGCQAVLVKGGHLSEVSAIDVLYFRGQLTEFSSARLATSHTHGTGCTLSAAITARLALGEGLHQAIAGAKDFLVRALESAPGFGHGIGPVNHFAAVKR